MTLKQLRYLSTLQEERHFGRAAHRLNVTQPTLSQQLRQLEQTLGATLIERGPPVALTPIGREVATRARTILREEAEIRNLTDRSANLLSGTVRFGVTPTLGPYLMPRVVTRLSRLPGCFERILPDLLKRPRMKSTPSALSLKTLSLRTPSTCATCMPPCSIYWASITAS